MSLWDVLDKVGGGSNSPGAYKPPKINPGFGGFVGGSGGSSGAATSSQQRSAPERLDVNQFVSGINFGEQRQQTLGDTAAQGGTQLLEAAGKAPGFTFERPLAVADTIAQQATGKSPIAGLEQAIGSVPILGSILGGAGDALGNLSSLPAAIANSGIAEALKKGTVEGWSDNQLVQEGFANPGLNVGGLQLIAPNSAAPETWAQFKDNARAKGWTDGDMRELAGGQKSSFDYGNKRMSADNLTEMALRVGSDPTNLLFGAGAVLKAGRGVGLLASSVARGAELSKPLAPALAAEALAKGVAQESTWMGVAQHFGMLGRGIGGGYHAEDVAAQGLRQTAMFLGGRALPVTSDMVAGAARVGKALGTAGKAYRNIAIGTTAAQVGLGVADAALNIGQDDNTPHSGFLEPLFDLNRKAFDNQPFSNNIAFSLWSAFHFPVRQYLGDIKAKLPSSHAAATYADVVKALGEGWGVDGKAATEAQVLERAGGADNIWNMIGHTHASMAFEQLAKNKAVQDAITHYRSLDEAVVANNTLKDWVSTRLEQAYKTGEYGSKETVARLKDWFANRTESGTKLNAVEFPWHGGDAIDKWHEYGNAVMPVNDVYRQRGNVILGLRDNLIDLDLEHMGAALKTTARADGALPLGEIRKWLSKYPQLLNLDPKWNDYLLHDAAPWQDAGPVIGKLKRATKMTPTARELYHESGIAETAAAKDAVANPIDEQFLQDRAVNGGATIGVSRLRPQIARTLGITPGDLPAVQRARLDPHIATFDEGIADAWKAHGYNYENISQSTISDPRGLAPAVEIQTNARLLEMRQQAAVLGELGGHEQTHLTISGERMRQLGLNPNGYEAIIQLPSTDPALMAKAVDAANREFPGAFDFNDTTGTFSIRSTERPDPAALARLSTELEGYFPKDLIGDTGMRAGLHRAYTEVLSKKKGPDGQTYAAVLRDAKRAGDPRATSLSAIRNQLAYRRPDGGNGVTGLGLQPELGRDTGAAVGGLRDQPLGSPAQGIGDPATAVHEPGYLYHTTDPASAAAIVEDSLRPNPPEGMTWPVDGGTGKRTYFGRTPEDTLRWRKVYTQGPPENPQFIPSTTSNVLFRVKEAKAGQVRDEITGGDRYATKPIGSQHLEVWGADGQWHPARGFFQSEVEPHIQALADTAVPAYHGAADVPDPLTLGLRAQEDAAMPGAIDESAALSQVAQTGDATAIERQRLARGEGARGAVLANAQLDADASRYAPLSKMLSDQPEAQKAELALVDQMLQDHWPQYTVKPSPALNIFADVTSESSKMAVEYLKKRAAVGDALAHWGPTGRISRFVDALTSPVKNAELGKAAEQELMAQLLPHGATPTQVREFIRTLRETTAEQTFGPTHVHLFRNPTSLGQQVINKIAAGDLSGESRFKKGIFDEATIKAVGRDNFARVLDRASNRFIRFADSRRTAAGTKGALARAVGDAYGDFQHSPVGDTSRLVSKTFYHVFRFMSDPRWWAMNTVEQDLLGATGYGLHATRVTGAAKAAVGPAALSHELHAPGAAQAQHAADAFERSVRGDNGWMYTRRLGGFVSRSFDVARPQDTTNLIRSLSKSDPIFQDLAAKYGQGEDVVKLLDDMLYKWDTKGAQKTLIDDAKASLGAAETERMMPFLQKLWEKHDQTYHDIVHTFAGNADRSTLERIANSYWLYWPISYQLKASKALIGALSHRFAGAETNLAGAALYAHYYEEHKAAMANDPSYAKMYADNPTSWFLAQMMIPITPGDMGVSLSRIPRYAGGELGLWGKYTAAKDPLSAAAAVMTLGPAYTATILQRLGRELAGRPTSAPAPTAPFFGNQ